MPACNFNYKTFYIFNILIRNPYVKNDKILFTQSFCRDLRLNEGFLFFCSLWISLIGLPQPASAHEQNNYQNVEGEPGDRYLRSSFAPVQNELIFDRNYFYMW
jgi:hypothetical protein